MWSLGREGVSGGVDELKVRGERVVVGLQNLCSGLKMDGASTMHRF